MKVVVVVVNLKNDLLFSFSNTLLWKYKQIKYNNKYNWKKYLTINLNFENRHKRINF